MEDGGDSFLSMTQAQSFCHDEVHTAAVAISAQEESLSKLKDPNPNLNRRNHWNNCQGLMDLDVRIKNRVTGCCQPSRIAVYSF